MNRLKIFRNITFPFLISFLFYACNSNTQVVEPAEPQTEKISMSNPVVEEDAIVPLREISYSLDSLKTRSEIDSLIAKFSEDELKTILAINRIEKNRLRPEKPIIIPDCPSDEFNTYSPFPETVNFLQCIPKTVLISQRVQAFGLYENGELVKWGPVSTGKKTTKTPNGLNYGNYKAKRKISTIDESWILPYYFNFMNFEGVGVHQYALPGYPASHGCVRLYNDDAKYIYDWAEMWDVENAQIKKNGTPFMIFGEFDYDAGKPWISLSENMKANDLTQEELNTLEQYIREYQEDPKNLHNITSKDAEVELLST